MEFLLEQFRKLRNLQCELEKEKVSSKNPERIKEIDSELDSIHETICNIEDQISILEHPNPTIEYVFNCLCDMILKTLPILLTIFDSIRKSVDSDVSVSSDLMEYISVLSKYAMHPPKWANLVEILQLPGNLDSDSDSESNEKINEIHENWKYRISCLHVIFYEDELHSDYLSDFGLLMAFALTNCDEYPHMLNDENYDDELIREFFSESEKNLDISIISQMFPFIFFKAICHPVIRSHFPEKIDFKSVNEICSFLENYHSHCEFQTSEFTKIIHYLKRICDVLEI